MCGVQGRREAWKLQVGAEVLGPRASGVGTDGCVGTASALPCARGQPPEMQIFFKTLTGKTLTITADPGERVAAVKEKLQAASGVPAAHQRLIFAGKQIEDHRTIADYNIQSETMLHMIIKLPDAVVPTNQEEWAGLTLLNIRDRSERLGKKMEELGDRVKLADFTVIKKFGTGANAQAYLAECKPDGQLKDHVDTLVVLKVLLHYKQAGDAAELERVFMESVEEETRGPGFPEYRFNVVSSPPHVPCICADAPSSSSRVCLRQVHVLGSFLDNATSLQAYRELDPNSDFIEPRTAFIVTPFFCGGDLQGLIKKGDKLPEQLVVSILTQIIDGIVKLQKHDRAHRDLKPDNVFFCGDGESLAMADFGEVGGLHLDYTKGSTSPGGAQEYLAPEIMSKIAGMSDGETAQLDYTKNDVYAAGLIAYRMCMCNMDASPWRAGSPPSVESLTNRIPADAYSERLRIFIENGLLHPDPSHRLTPKAAFEEIMLIQYNMDDAPFPPQPAPPQPAPPHMEPEPAPVAALAPLWEWCDDGQWKAYEAQKQQQLEAAWRAGERSVDVDVGLGRHFVDPKRMRQKSWDDPGQWDVRRREVPVPEGVPPGA